MGYHWIKNTDPVWQFDAFMFRPAVIAAIKIKKIRHAIDENAFLEHLLPKKLTHCAHSRFLFMCSASSGYGRRTSGHGAGSISCRTQRQRLSSILLKTTEIPTSTRRSGVMHYSGSISPYRLKRGMKPDKPVKGPVWQTDEIGILLSKVVSTPTENTE